MICVICPHFCFIPNQHIVKVLVYPFGYLMKGLRPFAKTGPFGALVWALPFLRQALNKAAKPPFWRPRLINSWNRYKTNDDSLFSECNKKLLRIPLFMQRSL